MRVASSNPMFLVFPHLLLLLLLLLLLIRFFFHAVTTRHRKSQYNTNGYHPRRLPPSPPGVTLPVLGHLHLVSSRHPHVSLRDLADRYGDDGLLLLRLGQVPTLVVSSPRAAESVLRAHDHAFASRPPSAVAAVLFSGPCDVALAPYGERWRQARRVVTTHLLSAKKVNALRRAREEEARRALLLLAGRIGIVVDVTDLVGAYVNDVVSRAVSGRFCRHEAGRNRTFRELSSGNSAVLGGFNVDDLFPSLAKLTGTSEARRLKERWDRLLDAVIDEHIQHRRSSSAGSSCREEDDDEEQAADFIDVLLSLQQEEEYDGLTREQVRVLLMEMFAAGTDTSSIVLEYAMVELVRHPHVMTKLQDEVRRNTPRRRESGEPGELGQEGELGESGELGEGEEVQEDMVREEDLDRMPFLKAVVKETLRLHPAVPLLIPRLSMTDCVIDGYTVPAGTRVIVNAWALGRDAASWDKAHEFAPERFLLQLPLQENGPSTRSRDFRFLPFGAGRRMCPGVNFGMATVEIMLANLLYRFDWELPPGTNKQDIDMTEVFGLTLRRNHKLQLVPRLRHAH